MPPKDSLTELFLSHDELMMPVLNRHLGEVLAKPRAHFELGDRLVRHSLLLQANSGNSILDAKLEIFTNLLPRPLLTPLRETAMPLGQLLQDLAPKVKITGRTLYRQAMTGRWGRRVAIQDGENGEILCKLDELLVNEADLERLLP